MKQVYKITNLKNMKSYIGVSIAQTQTHMDRFELHMTGKGGVWIKKDLLEGLATRDDFIIELLEEGNEPDDYYKAQEEFYIEHFDTQKDIMVIRAIILFLQKRSNKRFVTLGTAIEMQVNIKNQIKIRGKLFGDILMDLYNS